MLLNGVLHAFPFCLRCLWFLLSKSKLIYEWRFAANRFILASSPLRHTTRDFFFRLSPCGNSPSVTFSLTRRWVCLLWLCFWLLLLLTFPAYNISARTAYKTPFLCYSVIVVVETCLLAVLLLSNRLLCSCLFRGRCVATFLYPTILFNLTPGLIKYVLTRMHPRIFSQRHWWTCEHIHSLTDSDAETVYAKILPEIRPHFSD
jgi:hypothetical protein